MITHRTTLICSLAVILTGCSRSSPEWSAAGPREERLTLPAPVLNSVKRYGSNLRRLQGMDDDGNAVPADGVVIDIAQDHVPMVIRALRKELGSGYIVFRSDKNYGLSADAIAVLRAGDQFAALRTMGTNGWNYDLSPEKVLSKVREWDRVYGLDIVGAGNDWVEAEFKRRPRNMRAFAEEVYKFCPDVVDQGTETVSRLAAEMTSGNSVFLWWD